MKKKEWNKIANQIKFKNFIRLILKKAKKDPDFVVKKFKVFRLVDNLYLARKERMRKIKEMMAK